MGVKSQYGGFKALNATVGHGLIVTVIIESGPIHPYGIETPDT
jgi:hypothetical protein